MHHFHAGRFPRSWTGPIQSGVQSWSDPLRVIRGLSRSGQRETLCRVYSLAMQSVQSQGPQYVEEKIGKQQIGKYSSSARSDGSAFSMSHRRITLCLSHHTSYKNAAQHPTKVSSFCISRSSFMRGSAMNKPPSKGHLYYTEHNNNQDKEKRNILREVRNKEIEEQITLTNDKVHRWIHRRQCKRGQGGMRVPTRMRAVRSGLKRAKSPRTPKSPHEERRLMPS